MVPETISKKLRPMLLCEQQNMNTRGVAFFVGVARSRKIHAVKVDRSLKANISHYPFLSRHRSAET